MSLTLAHVDREGTFADLPAGEGDVDDVLSLLSGFVGAAVAAVSFVFCAAGDGVFLPNGIHDHHVHLANAGT